MKTALTFLLALFLCGPTTAQDLPPDILADQYLLEATKALESGNPQAAIRAFEKIEALDTEPPPEFAYFYGKLLVENSTALDDLLKGQSLLKSYVISIERDSEHYTPTLELLSVVGAKLEKAEAEKQRRAKLEARLPQLLANLQKNMVHVEGGTFTMGCTPSEKQKFCLDYAKPAHRVGVSSFEISKYEVPQELWEAVTGKNPSLYDTCPGCPVERVSWNDVQAFLTKLNDLTGERYRLPTEAEWEYAARGGPRSRGYIYAGSDNPNAVAWYDANSRVRTHPVGQKQANELGLYDMSGNVQEYVQDCWNESYAGAPSDGQAWESRGCDKRGVRGGSRDDAALFIRSTSRIHGISPTYGKSDTGFRIARPLPSERQRLAKLIPLVSVQGGSFTMGCTPEQGRWCKDNEKPAHRVRVSSFEISKYEVTQELWEAVMGENPSHFEGCAQCPVEQVSWNETQAFLTKLNDLTGERYRLPTEAEWEYAARGGSRSRGYMYAGSNNLDSVAWYELWYTDDGNSPDKTYLVGQKQPNELGLYDMSGNVFEWVQDWYTDDYYSSSPVADPQGPSMGADRRVVRGGGWSRLSGNCRVSRRMRDAPGSYSDNLGFRLARTP